MDNAIRVICKNGHFLLSESDIKKWPATITLLPLSQAMHSHKQYFINQKENLSKEGIFLHIPRGISFSTPIHFVFINSEQMDLCNRIVAEEDTNVILIEEYCSDLDNVTNVITELLVNKNSRIQFYKIQDENNKATHTSTIFIHQQQDSRVDVFSLAKGAQTSNENIKVNLLAKGAECYLSGLYSLYEETQQANHHLQIDHLAEHGKSAMLYKGIVDKKSRAVFNGKVYVHPKAQHTQACQANHNILLSKFAEVQTKPELEIYADDVKCNHGATVGQIDAEALFYLQSRGITKDSALKVLLAAFTEEVINKIGNAYVKNIVQQRISHYVEL